MSKAGRGCNPYDCFDRLKDCQEDRRQFFAFLTHFRELMFEHNCGVMRMRVIGYQVIGL
jgi:hypothetical protein